MGSDACTQQGINAVASIRHPGMGTLRPLDQEGTGFEVAA